MSNHRNYFRILFSFVFWVFIVSSAHGSIFQGPKIPINKAISLSEQYVKENNIDVSGYNITEAKYSYVDPEGYYWLIIYAGLSPEETIFIAVYENGKIEKLTTDKIDEIFKTKR